VETIQGDAIKEDTKGIDMVSHFAKIYHFTQIGVLYFGYVVHIFRLKVAVKFLGREVLK
jgi:hypothetical protein